MNQSPDNIEKFLENWQLNEIPEMNQKSSLFFYLRVATSLFYHMPFLTEKIIKMIGKKESK